MTPFVSAWTWTGSQAFRFLIVFGKKRAPPHD